MPPGDVLIRLGDDRGFRWQHRAAEGGEFWAKGCAFLDGRFHDSEALAGRLASALGRRPLGEAVDLVRGMNGVFAVVVRTQGAVFAAVDRLRSLPLFYGRAGDRLLVSDDAFWIRERTGDAGIDPVSEGELLRAGYVFGRATLSPSVRQLQPGECLIDGPAGLETKFYYLHVHGGAFGGGRTEHFDRLDGLSRSVFQRLIDSARGRTIVVPLSGGYDSRYIAAMLKALGCEKVVCYSYGRPGSFEVATSERVARTLGYPWHYIEYNRERWEAFFHSEDAAEFNVFSSRLVSLPCPQEIIAVKELRRGSLIPDDAVFAPGYAGATGFPVPPGPRPGAERTLTRELIEYTFSEFFYLANRVPAEIEEKIKGHRARTFDELPAAAGLEETISVHEAWFTAHRLTRFIVNAVRAFDFMGYEWRVPLWDNELTEYFYRVPEALRADRRLYEDYLLHRLFPRFGLDWKRHSKRRGRLFGWGKRALARVLPKGLFRSARDGYHRRPRYLQAGDINAFSEMTGLLRRDLGPDVPLPETQDMNAVYAVWLIRALRDAEARGELAPRGLGPLRPRS